MRHRSVIDDSAAEDEPIGDCLDWEGIPEDVLEEIDRLLACRGLEIETADDGSDEMVLRIVRRRRAAE